MWNLIRTLVFFSFSLSCVMLLASSAVGEIRNNILIVHMENSRMPGNTLVSRTIDRAMELHLPHRIFDEYLDENRLNTNPVAIAESMQEKYRGQKIDLVMVFGPAATRFILQHGSSIWPSIPKIFFGVDERVIPAKLPPNVTGITGSYNFLATVDLAEKLQPHLRNLFYVGGASPEEMNGRRKLAEHDLERYEGKLDIVYLNTLPWQELKNRLSHLPPDSAVLFTTYFMDSTGQSFTTPEACKELAKVSVAPVYGMLDTLRDCGIIGGSIHSIEDSAKDAAKMAVELLNAKNGTLPPPRKDFANRLIVDARQMEKWRISQSNVPPTATVINRESPIWRKHQRYFAFGAGAILLELILVLYLCREVVRRQSLDGKVTFLTERLITASEDERRHLARELHDDLGQRLSLVSIQMGAISVQLGDEMGQRYNISSPLQELDEVITDVHEISHRLHPSTLHHLGLGVAIRDLCRRIQETRDLKIELMLDQVPHDLVQDVSLCFYRIAQEALSNIVKHSGAKTARVILQVKDASLSMEISDTGLGFDSKNTSLGLGLTTMEERAKMVQGRFRLQSAPGAGTVITIAANCQMAQQELPNVFLRNVDEWAES